MGDLTSLRGIGGATAKELNDQGIDSIEALAKADPDEIEVPTGNVRTCINRAKQETITSQSAADMLDEFGDVEYISTGIEMLDEIIGGGWESGTIGVVYGKSGMGKSQVAFSTLGQAASEGPVAYLQTEMQSKSIAKRIASLAPSDDVLENINIYEAYSVEDQYQTYEKIVESHTDLELLAIDSFTAQFRMSDDFSGRSDLGERSTVMGKHLNRIGEIARNFDIPVVMTGQVYPTPEAYGKGDILWGGEKMKHFVSYFVRMSSGKGELVSAELENHPGHAEEGVLVNITNDDIEGVQDT